MTPAAASQSVVAVFDLDGTVTDCDTYLKFLRQCLAYQPARVLRALHLPVAVLLHKAGFFDNAWLKSAFLKAIAGGCSVSTLAALVNRHLADIMARHIRPAALAQIQFHRSAGHRLVLATASFDFYVEQLAEQLGFDTVVCTRSQRAADASLMGRIDGDNCYGRSKLQAVLSAIPDRASCTLVAYTDHHSDWQLLLESDLPVAVSPTRALRRLAAANGVEVKHW